MTISISFPPGSDVWPHAAVIAWTERVRCEEPLALIRYTWAGVREVLRTRLNIGPTPYIAKAYQHLCATPFGHRRRVLKVCG